MQYLYAFPSKNTNAIQDQHIICKSNKTTLNIRAKAVLFWSFQTFIHERVLWKHTAESHYEHLKIRGKHVSLDLYRTKDNFTRHNKKLDDLMYLLVWMEKVSLLFVSIPEQ